MSDTKTVPLLIGVQDLHRLLNISVREIWRRVSTGRLPKPVIREGRLVRWKYIEIVDWIDAQQSGRVLAATSK